MTRAARSLDKYEHPEAPVRDDAAVGPTEDLDREPDGVPHATIAAIALGIAALAAILLMLLSGHVPHHPGAALTVAAGVVILATAGAAIALRWRRSGRGGPHASR